MFYCYIGLELTQQKNKINHGFYNGLLVLVVNNGTTVTLLSGEWWDQKFMS